MCLCLWKGTVIEDHALQKSLLFLCHSHLVIIFSGYPGIIGKAKRQCIFICICQISLAILFCFAAESGIAIWKI